MSLRACTYLPRKQRNVTFARLDEGPDKGVPSRLSFALDLAEGRGSSRDARTYVRSAYFRQFVPHVSHRILVDRPFGAFHHTDESRVLQAPHVGVLEAGSATMEFSSSESPTCCPIDASSSLL